MSRRGASGDNLGGQRQSSRDERNAYARAKATFAQVQAARALPFTEMMVALAAVEPYRSRGKGRGTPSRRYGNPSGCYLPHQGPQERLRRVLGGWAGRSMTKKQSLAEIKSVNLHESPRARRG